MIRHLTISPPDRETIPFSYEVGFCHNSNRDTPLIGIVVMLLSDNGRSGHSIGAFLGDNIWFGKNTIDLYKEGKVVIQLPLWPDSDFFTGTNV